MRLHKLKKLREAIETASASLDDSVAIGVPELFKGWEPNKDYVKDDRFQYQGVLYKVLIDHRSQPDWLPGNAPSLYAVVLIPDPEVIPEWVQPDSTNAYMKGDRVRYNDKVWESTIDNNVWAPGTGNLWQEVEV